MLKLYYVLIMKSYRCMCMILTSAQGHLYHEDGHFPDIWYVV